MTWEYFNSEDMTSLRSWTRNKETMSCAQRTITVRQRKKEIWSRRFATEKMEMHGC